MVRQHLADFLTPSPPYKVLLPPYRLYSRDLRQHLLLILPQLYAAFITVHEDWHVVIAACRMLSQILPIHVVHATRCRVVAVVYHLGPGSGKVPACLRCRCQEMRARFTGVHQGFLHRFTIRSWPHSPYRNPKMHDRSFFVQLTILSISAPRTFSPRLYSSQTL
jgi:hypothetical protein